jgi:hypothetical protein
MKKAQKNKMDLHHIFGQKYKNYSEQVSMLIPFKVLNPSEEEQLVYEEDK